MKKKRIAFAWFDLVKLLQDTSYPDHLASQLGFSDSAKLLEILKDCTDILCVERGGIKDYSNKRKRHITPDDLIALPSLSKRIKRLCQDNSIEWCVKHYGFDAPSGKLPFEIDRLDLLSLHVLNSLDEAFAEAETSSASVCVSSNLSQAIYCWDRLQDKKRDEEKSHIMVDGLYRFYKTSKKNNQLDAGLNRAALNFTAAARYDLFIANMLLHFVYSDQFTDVNWDSLNNFVESWVQPLVEVINKRHPTFARMLIGHNNIFQDAELIAPDRLKRVAQQINYFDSGLLGRWIVKPIPTIHSDDNMWERAMLKLELEWMEEPNFHFMYPQIRDLSVYATPDHNVISNNSP